MSALLIFYRTLANDVRPMWITALYGIGFQYAGLVLALIGVAIMPIAFVFFRVGKKIRQRSKRATKY